MMYFPSLVFFLVSWSRILGGLNVATTQQVELRKSSTADTSPKLGPITPLVDRATLELRNRRIKPIFIGPPPPNQHEVGKFRVQVDADVVRCLGPEKTKVHWTTRTSGGIHLVWMGADDNVIYLAGYKGGKLESPIRLRRVDLRSGEWMESLQIAPVRQGKQVESIQGFLADRAHVAVLTTETRPDRADENKEENWCRVTCFKAGQVQPAWTKEFISGGELTRPSSVLLGNDGMPHKTQSYVQSLNWLGRDVLVCAGPVEDLFCLDISAGQERWRVPRVWEFERNFKGPSDWRHFFTRPNADQKGNKGPNAAQEEGADRSIIVGGPHVIAQGHDKGHVLVAIAKGPNRYCEYLSSCVVYELDSRGKPLAMVNLPRVVQGDRFKAQVGGLVWACEGGAFARLAISRDRDLRDGGGRGGPDLLCRVD